MFGLVLTTAGAAEIEAAYQAGEVVSITTADIGDGGGAAISDDPDVLAAATDVAGLFGTLPFSDDQSEEGIISGQIVIDCKQYPGQVLRAVGLRSSSGTLIAYGGYPDTYLPAQTDSIIKEVLLTFVLTLTHSSSVTLTIDPSRRILTQDAADDRYLNESENLADVADKATARTNLEVYSKEESDETFAPIDASYDKATADGRFQPKGSYYTTAQADAKFQLKGNYALVGASYTTVQSDAKYALIGASYTKAQTDAAYVTKATGVIGIRLGTVGQTAPLVSGWNDVPAGCVMTGWYVEGASPGDDIIHYKPIQRNINGTWATITG